MIDALVAEIPQADQGFRLTFSANPFPTFQKKLVWLRGDMQDNLPARRSADGRLDLPGAIQYYEKPPAELYVRDPLTGR